MPGTCLCMGGGGGGGAHGYVSARGNMAMLAGDTCMAMLVGVHVTDLRGVWTSHVSVHIAGRGLTVC